MLKSSFIDSSDFYPVSVCNEFVNIEKRNKPIQSNDYNLNKDISGKVNNNEMVYKVYQDPTVPSQSLYIESDKQFSNYYNKKDEIEHFYDAVSSGTDAAKSTSSTVLTGSSVDTGVVITGSLIILVIIMIPLIFYGIGKK